MKGFHPHTTLSKSKDRYEPDHKGLVMRNTNIWLNVEAMQSLHDIINYVVNSISSMMYHRLGSIVTYKRIFDETLSQPDGPLLDFPVC